jgi:hypothetical protein
MKVYKKLTVAEFEQMYDVQVLSSKEEFEGIQDYYYNNSVTLKQIESILTDKEKEKFKKIFNNELVEYQDLYQIYDYVRLRDEPERLSAIYKVIRDLLPICEDDPNKQRVHLKCNRDNYEFSLSCDDFINNGHGCPKCEELNIKD